MHFSYSLSCSLAHFHLKILDLIFSLTYLLCFTKISATQLVLKAHKEAVNSLSGSGNGSTKLGTVATVVAAANSTALESSKEIEAAMQIAMRNALGAMTNRITDGPMDDMTVMKVGQLFTFFTTILLPPSQIKSA